MKINIYLVTKVLAILIISNFLIMTQKCAVRLYYIIITRYLTIYKFTCSLKIRKKH